MLFRSPTIKLAATRLFAYGRIPGRNKAKAAEIRIAAGSLRHGPENNSLWLMSTISISELQTKPAEQWLNSAGDEDLVVNSKGQPVSVLLRVAPASLESTQALLRSVRALQGQAHLQDASEANGTSNLTASDIDAEITATRRSRREK